MFSPSKNRSPLCMSLILGALVAMSAWISFLGIRRVLGLNLRVSTIVHSDGYPDMTEHF